MPQAPSEWDREVENKKKGKKFRIKYDDYRLFDNINFRLNDAITHEHYRLGKKKERNPLDTIEKISFSE